MSSIYAIAKRRSSAFYTKIDFGFLVNDCHIWTGALSDEGYGDFRLQGRTVRAHRVGYIWKFGVPNEDTPFLDHIDCIGRFCVNPTHLEPVSNIENSRRGRGVGATQQRILRSAELIIRNARRADGEPDIFW